MAINGNDSERIRSVGQQRRVAPLRPAQHGSQLVHAQQNRGDDGNADDADDGQVDVVREEALVQREHGQHGDCNADQHQPAAALGDNRALGRLTDLGHRWVKRGEAEERVADEPEGVRWRRVCARNAEHGLNHVTDEHRPERCDKQIQRATPVAARQHQVRGRGEDERVANRVGDRHQALGERHGIVVDDTVDDQQPQDEHGGEADEYRVDRRGHAVPRLAGTNEHQQSQREERIAEQVKGIGERRERGPVGVQIVVPVPDRVGDQECRLGGHEHEPWTSVTRPEQAQADRHGNQRERRHGHVEHRRRPLAEREITGERNHGRNEVGVSEARLRHHAANLTAPNYMAESLGRTWALAQMG